MKFYPLFILDSVQDITEYTCGLEGKGPVQLFHCCMWLQTLWHSLIVLMKSIAS